MRLFVTGGAGFIGSNFIRYVLGTQRDVALTNFDKLTYAGCLGNLDDIVNDRRYTFVQGDICDGEALRRLLPGHDAIVNFAAETHVDRSIDGADAFTHTNVVGAGALFKAAMHLEIPRFLHISTDEVYGSLAEPGRFGEGDPLAPNNPYAASKAGADLLARAYAVTYGYPVTVTRTANNFGPYQHPEKLIPRFVSNLIDGSAVPLYGDGRHVRDWLFVLDNCAAQWLVLTKGEPGAVYNVGAGNEMSNRTLTYEVLRRFGLEGAAARSRIEYVPDRPGHDRRYALDAAKVRTLGWEPRMGFAEGLDATIDWYRAHEQWWRPLKQASAARRFGLATSSSSRVTG